MKTVEVSVIVPIYNTEKYLRKCVDSILRQTYKNLEVILVNDGSSDDSLKICREYEKSDLRVRVVNKKNGGLSSARNAGLDICTGKYITFVDSDDYLGKDVIRYLIKDVREYNADIAYIHEIVVDEKYEKEVDLKGHVKTIYDSRNFLSAICERKINCAVWGKLFKRELFDTIRFNKERLNEDFLLLSEMLLRKEIKIVEDTYRGYYYLERTESISRQGFGKSSRDAVYNTIEMKGLAKKQCSMLVPYYGAYAAYQARTALIIMTEDQYNRENEFVELCRETIKDNLVYLKGSFMSSKDRVFCKLYIRCPQIMIYIARRIREKL